MNVQKGPLLIVGCWAVISLFIAFVVTSINSVLCMQYMTIIIFLTPLFLRPTYRLICQIKTATFVVHKKKRQWLHLNPFLSTGKPDIKGISHYWRSLITTASLTLLSSGESLYMSSHLLSASRMAKLQRHFPAEIYLFRAIERPVSKMEQIGLQVDTFLKEWRWFKPAKQGGIVIVRRKNCRSKDKRL